MGEMNGDFHYQKPVQHRVHVSDLSVLIRTTYVVVWNLLEISTRESSMYLPSISFDRLEKFQGFFTGT